MWRAAGTRTLDGLQQEGEAPPLILKVNRRSAGAGAGQGRLGRRPSGGLVAQGCSCLGPRQLLFKRALQRINGKQADLALRHASRIDAMIKGAAGAGDVWNEFLRLGLSVSQSEGAG